MTGHGHPPSHHRDHRHHQQHRAQEQANAALPLGVEVTSFCNWADEIDEPDVRFNPDFYQNVLADGVEVTSMIKPINM